MTRRLRWGLALLLLVACIAQAKRAIDLLRAQRLLWAVEARTLALIRSRTLSREHVDAHLEALRDAAALDRAEVAVRVAIGSQLFLRGDFDGAVRQYEDSLALEPRPEIYLNMAKARQAQGKISDARRLYATALRVDPTLADEVPEEMREGVSETLRRQDDANRAQQDR